MSNVPENGPLPKGQCVARFHVDLDARAVLSFGNAKFYDCHVERNGLGRFLVLTVFDIAHQEPRDAV